MTSLPDLRASELTVSRVERRDLPALTELCVRCSEFFEMVEGRAGSRVIAEEILELLPPGKAADNKHLLGFWRAGSLLAVADLGEDYPSVSDWYVALFLMTPASRRVGLGGAIWTTIERWIRVQDGKSIELIVQQENPGARRFWEAHAFVVVDELVQRFAEREHRVWRMRKRLVAHLSGPGT